METGGEVGREGDRREQRCGCDGGLSPVRRIYLPSVNKSEASTALRTQLPCVSGGSGGGVRRRFAEVVWMWWGWLDWVMGIGGGC